MRSEIKSNPNDDYWVTAGLVLKQYEGLMDGYHSVQAAGHELSSFAFFVLNGCGGKAAAQAPRCLQPRSGKTHPNRPTAFMPPPFNPDLFDLIPLTIESERPNFDNMTHKDIERYTQTNGHCSALVKLTGDFQELFMSHSSWFRYQAMTRIMKHCAFGRRRRNNRGGPRLHKYSIVYRRAASRPRIFAQPHPSLPPPLPDNLPGGPGVAKKISFSSYPGCVARRTRSSREQRTIR